MQGAVSRRSEPESVHFRLLYAVCFGVFLIAAAVQRILPWHWFGGGKDKMHQSIFAQARSAAGICAAYAFMI